MYDTTAAERFDHGTGPEPSPSASPRKLSGCGPATPRTPAAGVPAVPAGFEVYRSGAAFALKCGPCGTRCGQWRSLGLAELAAAARRHAADFHAWGAR